MKKVLIGVGIGCGGLILVGVIAMVAGGLWVKGKVEGMAEGTEQVQKQEQRIAELNAQHAFEAPPKGQPVLLSEARLEDYFKIRAALKPVVAEFEEKSKQFKQEEGQPPDLSKGLEAYGLVMGMMADVRAKWLDALASQKMSPREFHAITASIYGSSWGEAMGKVKQNERAMLEQLKAALEQQASDDSFPAEARAQASKQIQELEKKIAALPPPDAAPSEAQKVHTANAALVKKYKQQIEEDATRGLDMLLMSGGSDLGAALQDAMGEQGLVPGELPMDEEPAAEDPVADEGAGE